MIGFRTKRKKKNLASGSSIPASFHPRLGIGLSGDFNVGDFY